MYVESRFREAIAFLVVLSQLLESSRAYLLECVESANGDLLEPKVLEASEAFDVLHTMFVAQMEHLGALCRGLPAD